MNHILKTLTLIFIFAGNVLHAQKNRFDVGIEGGPNLSFFIQKGTAYSGNRTPNIFASSGIIFQYNCKKVFSFRTGLSYQQKGYQTAVYGQENAKSTSRFDYLTLPFLVRATFGKKVHFFLNVGPYIGFLIGKTDRLAIESYEPIGNEKEDYRPRDFGFAGGLGIAVPIKKHWMISLEARNYSGILDIHIHPGVNGYVLTNTTDLNLGVAYRLGFRDSK
jgi:hypothetical protein